MKKLPLNQLKVNSFITVVNKEQTQTAKGGGTNTWPVVAATIAVSYDIGKQESAWYCEPKKDEGNGGGN